MDQSFIAAAVDEWASVGLRIEDAPVAVGLELPASRIWVDGGPTEDRLSGTCAIRLGRSDLLDAYVGGYVLLLGSDREANPGDDDGEIVMSRPVVLACWSRP